jgi:hypothetical protein
MTAEERRRRRELGRQVRPDPAASPVMRLTAEYPFEMRREQREAELKEHRKSLAGDDPVFNHVLAQVMEQAIRQAERIQRELFSEKEL